MALKFTQLTRDACRKAKPGETITEHGIAFERKANGDGRWKINVMVDGQRVHRVIGKESDGVTREQCERATEKLRTEARTAHLSSFQAREWPLPWLCAALIRARPSLVFAPVLRPPCNLQRPFFLVPYRLHGSPERVFAPQRGNVIKSNRLMGWCSRLLIALNRTLRCYFSLLYSGLSISSSSRNSTRLAPGCVFLNCPRCGSSFAQSFGLIQTSSRL